mmetsp:Transcript_136788/g.381299  ORF Transcript_136788/g.381299 Transcript_136788/m.381299 type:complete len:1097 (-) Transcript_136788:189-3479(-)
MVQEESQSWPAAIELEKWLMNTVKDADAGALFLRRILHMNPAYGQYLASDQDLAGIVQLFAKRFRAKILASENPIRPATLYEPLCEVTWRVVGHVLHTIIDLEDNENLPVPKEASGQVKMLLQTNVELSRKLNEMRRAYLRELTLHRDKQRRISENAERALRELEEQPVMFYEPLAFVLDEQTKTFVREVVEEKIKLEQLPGVPAKPPPQSEHTGRETEDLELQLKNALAEMRTLRSTAARDAEAAKRAKELEEKWREEAAQERKHRLEECGELEQQISPLRAELTAMRRRLEAANQAKSKEPVEVPVAMDDPQVGILREQLEKAKKEVQSLNEQIEELERELRKKEKELDAAGEKAVKSQEKKEVKEPKKKEPKETVIKEVKDTKAEEELKAQIEKHMKIEKELRAANRALEQALEEEKAKKVPAARPAPAPAKVEPVEAPKQPVAKVEAPKEKDVDMEIAKAVQSVTAQFETKFQSQEQEIERLKKELAKRAVAATPVPVVQEKIVEKVVTEVPVAPRLPSKAKGDADAALQERIEELEEENTSLKAQVQVLLEKLKSIGGKEAVAEVMETIKITVPMRKKRRKKAYERLYEDALRRIAAIRLRAQQVKELEQRELMNAAKKVRNRRSALQVANLDHLHKAAEATRARFHDALANYHESVGTPRDADGSAEAGEAGMGVTLAMGTTLGAAVDLSDLEAGAESGQDRKRVWGEDTEAVFERLEQLMEENNFLRAEVDRLRLYSPEFGIQGRQLMPRRDSVASSRGSFASTSPPPALTLGSVGGSGGAAALGSTASPASAAARRNSSSSPPPPLSRPTFGALRKSQSQVFSPSSTLQPGAFGPAGSSQSPSPDEPQHGFGSPGSANSPEPGRGMPGGLSPALSTQSAMPWNQRTPSGHLAGSMTLMSGTMPPLWRRTGTPGERAARPSGSAGSGGVAASASGVPAPPAGWNNPVPPGQALRGPGPDWVPNVPGRVPATTSLEPIRKGGGSTSPRSPSERRLLAEDPLRYSTASLPAPQSSKELPLEISGSRTLDHTPGHRTTSASKRRSKRPAPTFIDDPRPMTGFCVTPLRSQEALVSQNGGDMKSLEWSRWTGL